MMFFLFQTVTSQIAIYEFISKNYIEVLKPFFIEVFYNSINLFSKTQIYCNKIIKMTNDSIEKNQMLLNLKNKILSSLKSNVNSVELIKDGISHKEIIHNYDFVIYSDNNNGDSNFINKIIMNNKNNIPTKYEVSNIKFIMIELCIGEKQTFNINLKQQDYNFYVVGNVFNLEFFEYYVKSVLKENLVLSDNDKIILKILDENVNDIKLELKPKNQSILLEKYKYKIIN